MFLQFFTSLRDAQVPVTLREYLTLMEALDAMDKAEIPAEWLKKLAEKYLTEEEKKQIETMGWDKLMETLKKRLEEQKKRHQGGSKWIG
ncbi:MAG: VWA domain-containing protein, partial [Rhizobiales bacterium]|nr:VWA domain-containing protein [Hyphomicrobiales bacterium]